MKVTLSNDEVRNILAQTIADKIGKPVNPDNIRVETTFEDNTVVEVSVEV